MTQRLQRPRDYHSRLLNGRWPRAVNGRYAAGGALRVIHGQDVPFTAVHYRWPTTEHTIDKVC